jgi:hypothetical protein
MPGCHAIAKNIHLSSKRKIRKIFFVVLMTLHMLAGGFKDNVLRVLERGDNVRMIRIAAGRNSIANLVNNTDGTGAVDKEV